MKQTTVTDIYYFLDAVAPFDTALGFDNCGLLAGDFDRPVTGVGIALDITKTTAAQAAEQGLDLIVSHHPFIFQPLRALSFDSVAAILIRRSISAICAHTNLDAAAGGVNDCLCRAIGLAGAEPLSDPKTPGYPPLGRIGRLKEPLSPARFAAHVKKALSAKKAEYLGTGLISTIAVCAGSGGCLLEPAILAGADCLLAGNVSYHDALKAQENGIAVVSAGHYDTEQPIKAGLCREIKKAFPDIRVALLDESEPFEVL